MSANTFISLRSVVIIGAVGFVCAVLAYVGSRYMQRAYMSTVTMMSAQQDNDPGLARVTNQLGAVASLLGGGAAGGRRDIYEGLATLNSRVLIADFIKTQNFLDDILDIFGPGVAELSEDDQLLAAVGYFQSNILSVAYDNRTTALVVSITWTDRHLAAQLANSYVAFANEAMRQRGITSARNRIEFLNKAAEEAATVELRQAIYRLVEAQVNAEMMAATKPEYAFTIMDPAVPAGAGSFVRPQRFLLTVIAGMFGVTLAAAVLFFFGHIGATRQRS